MSEFLLQESTTYVGSRLSWWAKDGKGYTTDLASAEVFTREQALSQHECRQSDIPWPKCYVECHVTRSVDHQVVCFDEVYSGGRHDIPPSTPCYIHVSGRWDGNDLYWLTVDCKESTNLDLARVYTYEQAREKVDRSTHIIWPVSYIDAKARGVISNAMVSLNDALKLSGITLKESKNCNFTPRCQNCGKFITMSERYGSCYKCGADNRS